MHGRTHAHTPRTTVAVRCVGAPNSDYVMVGRTLFAGETMADRRLNEINYARATLYARQFFFPRINKILGRNETLTRDRMNCQTIQSVRFTETIEQDDRARIATCTLRTLTDRHKENYSIVLER